MTGAFDGRRQLTLMPQTITGNPPWDDSTPLGQEIPQQSDVLEVDRTFLNTKPAGPATLKKPPASSTPALTTTSTPAPFTFHHIAPPKLGLRFFVIVIGFFV